MRSNRGGIGVVWRTSESCAVVSASWADQRSRGEQRKRVSQVEGRRLSLPNHILPPLHSYVSHEAAARC